MHVTEKQRVPFGICQESLLEKQGVTLLPLATQPPKWYTVCVGGRSSQARGLELGWEQESSSQEQRNEGTHSGNTVKVSLADFRSNLPATLSFLSLKMHLKQKK